MLDADTLHVRLPNGHYLGIPRHRIATDLLSDLEKRRGDQTEPEQETAPMFRQSLLLNAITGRPNTPVTTASG